KIGAEEYASRLRIIRDAAAKAGRRLDGFLAGQTLLVAFGKSREQVMEKALRSKYVAYMAMGLPPALWTECGIEHPIGPDFEGFLDIVPSRVTPPVIDVAVSRMNAKLLERLFYMGTAEQIIDEVAPLANAGCAHFIFANMGAAFMGGGLGDFAQMAKLM